VRLEVLGLLKRPMTSSGFGPATFRLIYSLCKILCDERMDLPLMNRFGIYQLYISHFYVLSKNFSFYNIYKGSVSPGFARQILLILFTL
jgi:hypothetical protein